MSVSILNTVVDQSCKLHNLPFNSNNCVLAFTKNINDEFILYIDQNDISYANLPKPNSTNNG